MSVYKRANCPTCQKYVELRNGDDKLKRIVCPRCGQDYVITSNNAVYYIDYCHKNKRYREKVGPSKSQAESALAKRQTEIAENKFFDVRRELKIKFEDFADEYLNLHCKNNNKSWQTFATNNLTVLKRFFFGKCLDEITTQSIEQFRAERLKTVKTATVNRNLACLKCMYNKAIIWKKFTGINPVSSIKLHKENNQRLRYLEKEEIPRLLANCNKFLRPLITVALNTGMRLGELKQLKWQDIDYKREIIYLRETKNGETREIPMNEHVKNAFIEIPKNPDSPYIFCKQDGKPFGDIRKSFWTALRKSGIKEFHFHDLRHSFASHLVMSGHDLNTVRELLGHKTIQMTLRYAHLSPKHKKHAVDSLGKVFDTRLTHEQKESSESPNDVLASLSNT